MLAAAWRKWHVLWRKRRLEQVVQKRRVPEALWAECVFALPFVRILPEADLERLKSLVSLFLDAKEFQGADGLVVTDRHAVMVGIQACMPLLHIAPKDRPDLALAWYDSFVGIVLYPAQMRARREWEDEHGIVHLGSEILTGEVLEGGPLVLAWSDVVSAGASSQRKRSANPY
jgi:MtfA peptidase